MVSFALMEIVLDLDSLRWTSYCSRHWQLKYNTLEKYDC